MNGAVRLIPGLGWVKYRSSGDILAGWFPKEHLLLLGLSTHSHSMIPSQEVVAESFQWGTPCCPQNIGPKENERTSERTKVTRRKEKRKTVNKAEITQKVTHSQHLRKKALWVPFYSWRDWTGQEMDCPHRSTNSEFLSHCTKFCFPSHKAWGYLKCQIDHGSLNYQLLHKEKNGPVVDPVWLFRWLKVFLGKKSICSLM